MLREFCCLQDAQKVMSDLVNEVLVQGYTAYICGRILGRDKIDPAVVSACTNSGIEVALYETPNPTYDVHVVTADIEGTRGAVAREVQAAKNKRQI